MIAAAVRIVLHAGYLDDAGWTSHWGIREVHNRLHDIPPRVRVTLDLGPLTRVDHVLVAELRGAPCVQSLTIESCDWRLARQYAVELNDQDR